MNVFLLTDMEGIAGIDAHLQCYGAHDSDEYRHGLSQFNLDVHAAVQGCLDAGASHVFILDGHGHNQNRAVDRRLLSGNVSLAKVHHPPTRLGKLDESDILLVIGQHAMAGTLDGFLDHTQSIEEIHELKLDGAPVGEIAQALYYAARFGVPCAYLSGDVAACKEAESLVPGIITTPTKQGIGWNRADLYDTKSVRDKMRADIAMALKAAPPCLPLPALPVPMRLEFNGSRFCDTYRKLPDVTLVNGRTIEWELTDFADIYTFPLKTGLG